jgi:cytochrome c oxidase subunit 2
LQPLLVSFLTPDAPASPNADEIQAIYVVMLVVTAAIGLAVIAALLAAAVRFRARRGQEPAPRTAAPRTVPRVAAGLTVLALVVFVLGVVYSESFREAEASGPDGLQAAASRTAQVSIEPPPVSDSGEALTIDAIGQQWLWRYEYPVTESAGQSFQPVFSYQELVVPVDTTVVLNVTSTDVLHEWGVPSLGGKVQAIPGQVNTTWFKAEEEGTYAGASYMYSGPSYPAMRTKVTVVSPQEYQSWLETQQREISKAQEIVQEQVESSAAEDVAPAGEGIGERVSTETDAVTVGGEE